MSKKDLTPLEKVILKESSGQFRVVNKRDVDLTNYEFVGMKQLGKDTWEEYHAK